MKPRLLDLFCGGGGATRGYQIAGFHVTGVDIAPQPNYVGDEFVQADALEFPLDGFDAVHASPPCQHWTAYKRRRNHVGEAPELVDAIRQHIGAGTISRFVPVVIENVRGAPLRCPIMLCGSAFGLDVRRHRYFEVHPLPLFTPGCFHGAQTPRFPPATNRTNLRRTVEVGVWRIPLDIQQEAMGIDWMTREELSQAIPPAYTEWIGTQLLGHLRKVA